VAFDGPEAKVNRDVRRALELTHKQGKPIGAMCISPAIVAKVLPGVTVTVGDDPETEGAIQAMGGHTKKTSHAEVVVDDANKVFTTPCYMLEADIAQIADGADNLVKAMLTAMA
jgi:enhancing lycopene biosynthesis protein 2